VIPHHPLDLRLCLMGVPLGEAKIDLAVAFHEAGKPSVCIVGPHAAVSRPGLSEDHQSDERSGRRVTKLQTTDRPHARGLRCVRAKRRTGGSGKGKPLWSLRAGRVMREGVTLCWPKARHCGEPEVKCSAPTRMARG
jgi:hypothetical protein